jgi:mRNA interferase MazF
VADGLLIKTVKDISRESWKSNIENSDIVPLTSKGFDFVFRPKINFDNKIGLILLDQIRTVDNTRLVKRIGQVDLEISKEISSMLVKIFEY